MFIHTHDTSFEPQALQIGGREDHCTMGNLGVTEENLITGKEEYFAILGLSIGVTTPHMGVQWLLGCSYLSALFH